MSATYCPACGEKEFRLLHFRMRGERKDIPTETWRCGACGHTEEQRY